MKFQFCPGLYYYMYMILYVYISYNTPGPVFCEHFESDQATRTSLYVHFLSQKPPWERKHFFLLFSLEGLYYTPENERLGPQNGGLENEFPFNWVIFNVPG